MEFWLITEQDKIQLPVPPSSFERVTGLDNTTTKIIGLGEINTIGKRKLATIEISTFWPNQQYEFCDCEVKLKPYEFVKKIENILDSQKPVRLVITGTDCINDLYSIEDFKHREEDGSGDVYFSLGLKKYKIITVKETNSEKKKTELSKRDSKEIPKTYKVVKDDTLLIISKKVYGDSSKYSVLQKKNGIKNPNSLKIGQVLNT